MTYRIPARNSNRAPAATEELNTRLAQALRTEIQIALTDLDRGDQTRVLLKVQAFIADTLEALETSTET
jgi:hypothetical protein